MDYPLRCLCGAVQGQVDTRRAGGRGICYCKDCQAYAYFLERQAEMLNSQGGTEIIAGLPRSVRFTRGADKLACMSLSSNGLLRWYASCCRTAIGNTLRDRKLSYVGLVRTCLPGTDSALDEAFGSSKVALHTGSARGNAASMPAATVVGVLKSLPSVLKIARYVIGARLSGKYKDTPFFNPNGSPINEPKNLTVDERRVLDSAASRFS